MARTRTAMGMLLSQGERQQSVSRMKAPVTRFEKGVRAPASAFSAVRAVTRRAQASRVSHRIDMARLCCLM